MSQNIWMIRAGSGSWLIDDFLRDDIASIGWNETGKIPRNSSADKIRDLMFEAYPDWTAGQVGQAAGQLNRFINDIKKGDFVVTYDSYSRQYYTGVIISNYKYSEDLDYFHYRDIEWNDGPIDRDLLQVDSKNALGSLLTVFQINNEVWEDIQKSHPGYLSPQEIEEFEEASKAFEQEELKRLKQDVIFRASEFIKDSISHLDPLDVEKLMIGILNAMGYKARSTGPGPDLGSDIYASPDGLEMTEPIIKVEVKHHYKSKDKVSAPEIRNFVGGLRVPTKGIFVSTTGFSKDARYEAERANFQVTLIDVDRLIELLTEYYEKMDSESKALVPLRKVYWPVS